MKTKSPDALLVLLVVLCFVAIIDAFFGDGVIFRNITGW